MGTIEPSLVRTPAQDNEEAISIPIETSNIRPTTRETRKFMNRNRNTRVKEEIKEIEKHKKSGCIEGMERIPCNASGFVCFFEFRRC